MHAFKPTTNRSVSNTRSLNSLLTVVDMGQIVIIRRSPHTHTLSPPMDRSIAPTSSNKASTRDFPIGAGVDLTPIRSNLGRIINNINPSIQTHLVVEEELEISRLHSSGASCTNLSIDSHHVAWSRHTSMLPRASTSIPSPPERSPSSK